MPRAKKHTKETLSKAAMTLFWTNGYDNSSLDDLVKATGVSRHGIYGDFGDKRALFLACLETYNADIVTPAFAAVEACSSTLATVAAYFEHQIQLAEETGLPGPGCLFANSMTELAPHDAAIRKRVEAHNQRLADGFSRALQNEAPALSNQTADRLGEVMSVFAQGLWSASRVTHDADQLRTSVGTFLDLIRTRLDQ